MGYITNTIWRDSPHDRKLFPKAAESIFAEVNGTFGLPRFENALYRQKPSTIEFLYTTRTILRSM
jgi:hypothetical protein